MIYNMHIVWQFTTIAQSCYRGRLQNYGLAVCTFGLKAKTQSTLVAPLSRYEKY